MSKQFKMVTAYNPAGDQPKAIEQIVNSINQGLEHTVLLGVTGSGKTFTMAKVIEALNRPTLVMAPNKTLAAQLYQEFRGFFPHNAVEYFVSYYDYYQPEAYVASSDTYIEKEATINKDIEKLRLSATRSLLERRDVIIVASVSCIYGLGSPEFFGNMKVSLAVGEEYDRQQLLRDLVGIQYVRNSSSFYPGTFRVMGDTLDIYPIYEDHAYRIEFFGEEIETIRRFDALTGKSISDLDDLSIFPGSHFVTPQESMKRAVVAIREELDQRTQEFKNSNQLLEAQRLSQRTQFDMEMLSETGFCHGIENYSRHLEGRPAGSPPSTLLDYFPQDFLLFLDESHVTVPQIGGMFAGDRSRKDNLVKFGFRLPSAVDNRPLRIDEFWSRTGQVLFVSATPGPYEQSVVQGEYVEQIIRPTGLMDPTIQVVPTENQIDHLFHEIQLRVEKEQRTLVTTLTKRMAEDLADHFDEHGLKVAYLHSDIDTIERVEILLALRKGIYDVLVGVNLLREGLDLPEVGLVAILDADKQGFLRSRRSLIQTVGRAARNVHGTVIMYADRISDAMRETISETERRRKIQHAYNEEHGLTPESVVKSLSAAFDELSESDYSTPRNASQVQPLDRTALVAEIARTEKEMYARAEALEFEKAAELRDELAVLKDELLRMGI
ncbi:MAG: excinuclease ABC subunit B [Acidobacteria bacterium]|nr:MAG: excinuclease ABC subunit B [Acidobacteriota bacterium]